MQDKGTKTATRHIFTFFIKVYPMRTAMLVALMVVAGIAEGVGVLAIIPVLEMAEGTASEQSRLGAIVVRGLGFFGVQATLGTLLTAVVVAISLKAILLYFAQKQIGFTVAGVTRDLRLRLLRTWFDAQWSYFVARRTGELVTSLNLETARASGSFREACYLLAVLIQMAAYLTIAAALSWRIAVGTLGIGAVLFIVFRRFFLEARAAGLDQTRLNRSLSARLVDVLQGIKPLKAMGRQHLVWPLLEHEIEGLNQAQRRGISASQGLSRFQEPIVTLVLAAGLYVLLGVQNVPLADVIMLAFIFHRLMAHINGIQNRYQMIKTGESAFEALQTELASAGEKQESVAGTRPISGLREGIRLDRLGFSYGEHPVLEDVSAELAKGSLVAIMGESGSGKTTLADLIVGLHSPDEGRILLDGVPLGEVDLRSWRNSIGYVPQEMLLFNDTILNNVTLGDESLTREDAERALRMAGAWEFVCEKEGGLDHVIGEKGSMISGGQRQRIAIARALVTKPSVLVLDEVTTALDPATEQAICETLKGLTGEVTVLTISHQPAMRKIADVVFLMRSGRLEPAPAAVLAG